MATYLMQELLVKSGKTYLDKLNIHILPSSNPDGYEYSRNFDRLWRKTRRQCYKRISQPKLNFTKSSQGVNFKKAGSFCCGWEFWKMYTNGLAFWSLRL